MEEIEGAGAMKGCQCADVKSWRLDEFRRGEIDVGQCVADDDDVWSGIQFTEAVAFCIT